MKISRFIQFLCLCALLVGSPLRAGSLSRAISKVSPAMTVGAEEPATEAATEGKPSPAVAAKADRIVASTATETPAASQSSSRRNGSAVVVAGPTLTTQPQSTPTLSTPAAQPTTLPTTSPLRNIESASPAIRAKAPEDLAHKPATAAPTPGKIIHPTYPKATVSPITKPEDTAKLEVSVTNDAESNASPAPAPLGSTLIPLLAPTTSKSATSTTPHNALRDADGGHESPLRSPSAVSPNADGPSVTGPTTFGSGTASAPALLAPPAGLRSPTDPQIVKPAELAPTTNSTAKARITLETPSAKESSLPPRQLSGGLVAGTPNTTTPKTIGAAPSASTKSVAPRDTRPQALASDVKRAQPVLTSDPSQPGRLLPLRGDDEDAGEKSVITRTPADAKSRQLFESQEELPLTPEMVQLKKRTQAALAHYYQNWTLNTRDQSPWEVMHAIVAYGVDTRIRKGGPSGEPMTAIGHLCFSGVCKNQPILTIRKNELYALRGPGVQGHSGQFLAILAQSYLQRDYPLYVGGQKFTLEDLIEAEKKDCEAGTELTFKLISLMHYLPSDATWTNFQGQEWSLDRLVREEIVQPVRGAACGGTHRLMGLSYAIRKREQRGEPITGIYLEAQKYIDQYHKYTWSLQNPDGSFSTAWFVRKEARSDIDRRMQTTGHTLEWLSFSLSDEELRDPKMVKAVKYVTDLLLSEQVSEWEIGHLGHALHALQIYNERVFGGPVRSFEGLVSRRPLKTAQRPTQDR